MINASEIGIKDLKPGDTLIFRSKAPIGRGIQIFDTSDYNHAETIGSDLRSYGAVMAGYEPHDVKSFRNDENIIQIVVKRPKYNVDIQTLNLAIRDMYDVDFNGKVIHQSKYEFIGIAWKVRQILFGGWKGDKEVWKNVFCSKAAGYIAVKLGCQSFKNNWWQLSPGDIADEYIEHETYVLNLNL